MTKLAQNGTNQQKFNRVPGGGSSNEPWQEVPYDEALSVLYDRHADALYSLALLLCTDADRSAEVVVAALAHAGNSPVGIESDDERRRLAVDVWRTCPHDGRDGALQEQGVLGLVLFGCHTYRQAAVLTGVTAESAALGLRSVLHQGAQAATTPHDTGAVVARQGRR